MTNKKFVVKLSGEERKRLNTLISKGKATAKSILKARILLKADQSEAGEGWSDEEICHALDTNVGMVARVREKLVTEGLDAVFARKKRETPPIEPIFDGENKPSSSPWPARSRQPATLDGRSASWRSTSSSARSSIARTSIQSLAR
jgi:Homeodomain-like domain